MSRVEVPYQFLGSTVRNPMVVIDFRCGHYRVIDTRECYAVLCCSGYVNNSIIFAVVSLIQRAGTVCWSEFADVLASSTDV